MKLVAILSASVASLVAIAPAPVLAARTLDQSFLGEVDFTTGFTTDPSTFGFRRAQTVTAGLTGKLIEVHVRLGSDDQTSFSKLNIFDTTSGAPSDTLLGTGSLASIGNGFAVFSTDLSIAAGQVFALEPILNGGFANWAARGNTYGRGSDYFANPFFGLNAFTQNSLISNQFQTYVDVPGSSAGAVPEPSTWAMMIGGVGIAGGALRRRRAKVRTTVSFA